jgi:uncharacterized protein
MAAQQQSVDFMMRHKLRDRYIRLDANQSKEQEEHLALDVATVAAQSTIRGLAEATFRHRIGDGRLKDLLNHQARKPTFFASW